MIDQPRIVQAGARLAAVIRLTVPRERIQEVMRPGIAELMTTVAAQHVTPAGPLFTHHLKMDPGTFDFELGVPVTTPVSAAGRVKPGQLPAATVARTIYHGPYEDLGAAWGEFDAWITAAGHTPAPNLWECYVTGPESSADPAAWRTELNRPLLS
jgi:effector-binding domain-containing protein